MNIRHFRILARLRFRQFFRQKNKGLTGKIVLVVYFWFLEALLYFMLKDGAADFPPLLVAGILRKDETRFSFVNAKKTK